MRHFRHIIGACLLAAGLTPVTVRGQAADQTPAKPPTDTAPAEISPSLTTREREGQVIQPEQAGVNTVDSALRPVRPGIDPLPPEVKDRLRTFEQYRNEYLRQQEEIRKRLLGTTDEDRQRIREQFDERMRELRERWREQSVATREELRDRRKELLDRLPNHREVLEKLREDSRQNLRERRERRGIDN